MITAYNDNVRQYFCSNSSLPVLDAANYCKFSKITGYDFIKDRKPEYVAVGQGSSLKNLDNGDEYRYIINSIDSETLVQTGVWKKQS